MTGGGTAGVETSMAVERVGAASVSAPGAVGRVAASGGVGGAAAPCKAGEPTATDLGLGAGTSVSYRSDAMFMDPL